MRARLAPVDAVRVKLATNAYCAAYGSGASLTVELDPTSYDPYGFCLRMDDGLWDWDGGLGLWDVWTCALEPGEHTLTVQSATFSDLEDQASLSVVKVDIEPAETNLWWAVPSAALRLTPDSHPGGSVDWTVSPSDGLAVTASDSSSFTFSPTNSTPGQYTVTATSALLPGCRDTCTVRIVKTEFFESAYTDYDFSPSLGEEARLGVRISPTPPVSGFEGLSFKLEIVRETENGGDQHIGWVKVGADSTPESRPVSFASMAFDWDGRSSATLQSANGRDVFQGVAASSVRVFPPVAAGQPVPPPFVTAVAKIVRDSNGFVVCEARRRVFVPQVVKMMYDTASVDAMLAGYFTQTGGITMIQPIPTNQWPTYRAQIASQAQAYYSAENVNLRFVDSTASVTQPYSVVLMYGEDSLLIGDSYILGVVSGTLDEMNANPSQTGILYYKSYMESIRCIVVSNVLNNVSAPSPVTPDETVSLWAHIAAHESGHTLGLVANTLLGGDISGNHNPFPFNYQLMDPGTESTIYQKMGRGVGAWSFTTRSANYLRFILPKQ